MWTIPPERMKHRVPLSARALEVLAEAKANTPRSEWSVPVREGSAAASHAPQRSVQGVADPDRAARIPFELPRLGG